MIRLRQVALVATDLDPVVDALCAAFGLTVCFHDPGVAEFGLHNALMVVGDQFIEVVSPTREGTTAGRLLDKRGGDGGYMVIFQVDDHPGVKARADSIGIRRVVDDQQPDYWILQLHPADTGGTFLEIDVQHGGESYDGPWMPAGRHWRENISDTLVAITSAEIQSPDPKPIAERWAHIIGVPAQASPDGSVYTITADNGTVRFVHGTDGRPEGLGGIDVTVRPEDLQGVLERAAARGLSAPDDPSLVNLCGMRIRVSAA